MWSCVASKESVSLLFSFLEQFFLKYIVHSNSLRFNYRATRYFVEHGWDDFINWFDERAWYPLGRIVGGTVYPGLMLTSGMPKIERVFVCCEYEREIFVET